jgi:hypothetical protein
MIKSLKSPDASTLGHYWLRTYFAEARTTGVTYFPSHVREPLDTCAVPLAVPAGYLASLTADATRLTLAFAWTSGTIGAR